MRVPPRRVNHSADRSKADGVEVHVHQRLRRQIAFLLVLHTGTWGFLTALVVDSWLQFSAVATETAAGWQFILTLLAGLMAGSVLALFNRNPARAPGMVPFGWLAILILCIWFTGTPPCLATLVILGGASALVLIPSASAYHDAAAQLPDWLPVPVLHITQYGSVFFSATLVASLATGDSPPPESHMAWFVVLAVLMLAFSLACFYRAALEWLLATISIIFYRFRQVGPGVGKFPRHGPVLVIANHAAWLDPFWLGKVIPRPVTPMMSSKFYDLPVISFLMRKVVRAIRVQDSAYRQKAPELEEAVRRLDLGECVMIFPEGWLRRTEHQLLRNFHQGVWRILRDRPHTPVVAFWIEGGWGSWWSHRYARVGKGKPFDIMRKLTIAVGEPEVLSAEMLADGPKTRHYLREKMLAVRNFVPDAEPAGLPPGKTGAEIENSKTEE